ncbi:MAG: VCBS repeat-containing protein [Gammaproteobacteria bacterium]|nr:VCBS repeat-containing protein [Gammaproteobacteria bacterium]
MRVLNWWNERAAAISDARRIGAAVGLLAMATTCVQAQPAPTAPASSSTGSYTVSYMPCSSCSHWLEEKAGDGGTWQYVGQGSVTFTSKPAGTYYYRVVYLYLYYYSAGAWSYASQPSYGAAAAVKVGGTLTQVESLERQLNYRFEVRRGDLNGDGRQDLFVNRTSGGTAGNGVLEAVLLLQQSSGRFSPRVPTSSQRRTASAWPQATAALSLRDVNADGFADVVLRGVAGAVGASAAMNQIVYSPGWAGTQSPLGVRAIDSSLRLFARDVHRYLRDPGYFANTAPYVIVTTTYYDYWCPNGYGDPLLVTSGCYYMPYTYTTTVRDYSVFNPSAITIWSEESSIYSQAKARSTGLSSIESVVEKVLTVPVGGWDLRGRRGEAGTLEDRDYGQGFELFVSLLGIASAEAQEVPRRSGTVYVTGRRIIGWLPFMHTALEYNRSTVSAYDTDSRMLGNGRLVSEKNWGGDLPHLMMTLGTASRSSTAASTYWTMILAADTRYDDNLPYSPTPLAGQGRYNSNGYTHGIIRATGGRATVNMNGFVGGNVPVPSSSFN